MMTKLVRHAVTFLLCSLFLVSGSATYAQYQTEIAFPNLSFDRPVDLQDARDGSSRLFVVEQKGVVRLFQNNPSVSQAPVFLDIQSQVDDSGNEEGLLGLAFHPEFATNGHFYVNYTASDPNRTVVSRFSISSTDPDVADPASELVLLTLSQPYSNHNGGQLQFGPDGMLYIAVGDGGSGGDPQGNGQNRETLLGSILRIDVDTSSGDLSYGIPPDNPFAGNSDGFREEIYAYGLRNPWRFSFDSETGALWTGDVGQNAFEEVSIVESGRNYGWNIMEGFACYGSTNCSQTGLTLPVYAYPHGDGNSSITGGYVYRGTAIPSLAGKYVYADFISGRVWALTDDQGAYSNELLVDASFNVSSFGVDVDNELYLCGFDGRIHRLTSVNTSVQGSSGPMGAIMRPPYPNPSWGPVHVPFQLPVTSPVDIDVYDVLGRHVAQVLDRLMPAGQHVVSWSGIADNGTAVSPGLYWIRMDSGRVRRSSAVVFQPL